MPQSYRLIYQFTGKKEITLDLDDVELANQLRALAFELERRHDYLRDEPGPTLTLHVGLHPNVTHPKRWGTPQEARHLPPHREFRPGLAPGVVHPHLPPGVAPSSPPQE